MKICKFDKVDIVISQNATKREIFASEELCKYLKLMLMAEVNITGTHNKENTSFIIGGPSRNMAAEEYISVDIFNKLVPGPEGAMVKTLDDNTLLIAGSEGDKNRGTIYAVYDFLEIFCGCALSAYSSPSVDAGEFVPEMDELIIENKEHIVKCATSIKRGACVQYSDCAGNPLRKLNTEFFDFLSKNRYNLFSTWAGVYEKMKDAGLIEELSKRGIGVEVGHHDASDIFMPADGNKYFPEKYYETHPEFFRLEEDGTRFHPVDHMGQMIFCYQNPELIEEFSKNVITWLSYNEDLVSLSLPPHDGTAPQCCCPLCKDKSKTENYCYFVNEVAKRVGKVYPEIKISLLIYVDIWECPENIKLCSNVDVWEATWAANGLRRIGKKDGSALIGTHFHENLLSWKKTGAEVSYYDYYMGIYAERQRYLPMADEVQAIWKGFIKDEIIGATTQIECFHIWNHIFNFYTFGRTAYNVELSMEDNLWHFTKIFGKGAPYIADAIRKAEECMDGQMQISRCGIYLMENIDKEYMYDCYEKALLSAETPRERNNVRLMRMAFRYSDLETREENAASLVYQPIREYENINPELLYMTRYDSFREDNDGYGIMIPCTGKAERAFVPDKWYDFE